MSIAEDILKSLKTKVKRATAEGKAEDFYFDEADREAMKAMCSIMEADLPNTAKIIAQQHGFL